MNLHINAGRTELAEQLVRIQRLALAARVYVLPETLQALQEEIELSKQLVTEEPDPDDGPRAA